MQDQISALLPIETTLEKHNVPQEQARQEIQ